MDQNQYDRRNAEDSFQQDLWNDYLDSQEKEKKEEPQSSLSDQVEQDLYSYQRQKNSRRPALAVILLVTGAIAATALAVGIFAANTAEDDYSGAYVVEENYDDYDYSDAYEQLSDDIGKPGFVFSGEYYSLPVSFSEFNLNTHVIDKDAFSEEITEVGAEPVRLTLKNEYGENDAVLLVVSPDGTTVPLEQGKIIGISSSSYEMTVGGWHSPGTLFEYVQEDLNRQGYEYSTYQYSFGDEYRIAVEAPDGSGYDYYNLSFDVQNDRVSDITMLLSNEDLH